MLEKEAYGYLAYVQTKNKRVEYSEVAIVKEFPYVFPEKLPGLPSHREIEFAIEIPLEWNPISIPPYRMALAKLKKLKSQLQDLLDKGFIQLIVSA